ncbi:MAG: hypothetical protein EOM20_07835 [Spartobacteria bacterium]|nr:hypothetical protein [Spartobacteria bacterium]
MPSKSITYILTSWKPVCLFILLLSYLSASGATYYMEPNGGGDGSTWDEACPSWQELVEIDWPLVDGDVVLCSNGVYDVGGIITPGYALTNRFCITNAITVRSVNGPEVTFIKGAPGSNGSNDLDAIRGVYLSGGAQLIGFTISNGHTMASGDYVYDRAGGGIWIATNCAASNLVVCGNRADQGGGGVFCFQGGTLDNSAVDDNVSDNDGGAGVYLYDGSTLNSCTVNANASGDNWGGGIYCLQGGTLNDCTLSSNSSTYGGGAYLYHGGTLNNCTLRDNTATDGVGGACLDTSGTLNNCLVIGNMAANYAGGVEIDYAGDAAMNNCTIAGNTVSSGSGGVYLYQAGIVNNCIIYGNTGTTATDIYTDGGGSTIRNTCGSDGLTNGVNGCTTNNPAFVGEYRLTQYSPCFNTGDNSYAPTNVTPYDLAGSTRIMFNTVDMGAYETQVLLSTNQCLPAGGDTIIITNGTLGDGVDITNVTVCGSAATIDDQGINWLQITLGASTDAYQSITGDILIQSTSVGDTVFIDAFTYLQGSNLPYYVDAAQADDSGNGQSWATAKKTIQAGVDAVTATGTVWVTNGVYDAGGAVTPGYALTNRVCIEDAITVRSVNGPDVTIISGADDGGGLGAAAIRGVYLGTNASLIGFTVTNGWTHALSDYEDQNEGGGGVYLASAGSVISNCVISGCHAGCNGGGAAGSGDVWDSELTGNVCGIAGGGFYGAVMDGNVYNSIISGNTAAKQGGGAAYYAAVDNCLIVNNTVTGSGGGDGGGGLYAANGTAQNCTIVKNCADQEGAITGMGGSFYNLVVYGNTNAAGAVTNVGAVGTLKYSCSTDFSGGEGCVTNDPQFVGFAGGNYQLQQSSPCVNSGANANAPTNTTPSDLNGHTRIVFTRVDMGAYEVQVMLTTNVGPYAGGNTITITNGNLGDGSDITNVTVSGSCSTIDDQGANWVTITLGPAADNDTSGDVVIQSTSVGETTFAGAYTYNPKSFIGDESGWMDTAGLPVVLDTGNAVVYSNMLYSVGGTVAGSSSTNVYRFDGTSWIAVEGLPGPRRAMGCVVYDGLLYALGGIDASSVQHTNVWTFDGTSWSETVGLPYAVCEMGCAVWNGKIYCIAGGGGGTEISSVCSFDGASWAMETSLPGARTAIQAQTLNGTLYALGGYDGAPYTNVWTYDGSAWTEVPGYPIACCAMGAAVREGLIYSMGGMSGPHLTNCWTFDGSTWTEIEGLPRTLYAPAGATYNGQVYCVGGYYNGGGSGTTNVLTYPSYTGGVSPVNGSVNGGVQVTINGVNLGDGSDITNVTLCGVEVTSIDSQSATQVVVTAAAGTPGDGDVCVYSTSYGKTVKNGAFSYYELSTDNGPYAGGNSITITNGTLGDGADITNVTVGGVSATITGQGANWVTITLPEASAAGSVDVLVQSVSVGDTLFANAYTYNPAGQIGLVVEDWSLWQPVDGTPSAITYGGAGILDNDMFVAGGVRGYSSPATNAASFDGEDWTLEPVHPLQATDFGSAIYSGAFYTVAGHAGLSYITNVVYFDGSSWTETAGLPEALGMLGAGVLNGYLYSVGGTDGSANNARTNVFRFDGSAWTEVAGLPEARRGLGVATFNGALYALGGQEDGSSTAHTNVYRFDGSAWTEVAGLPQAKSQFAVSTLRGKLCVIAGLVGFNGATTVHCYDGTNWMTATNYPVAVYGLSAAELDGYLYGVSGTTDDYFDYLTNAYRYPWREVDSGVSPDSGSWTGGYPVVITGTNLCNGADATNVTLCGVSVASIDSQSLTQLVVTAGQANIAGAGDVRVYSTSYGESVKSNAFEYLREQQAALVFTPTTPQAYLSTNALTTSGGSGTGAVSYAVLSGPGMIVDDTNLTVTAGTGTIEILATKAQDDLYNEAAVTGTVTAAKAGQTITFAPIAPRPLSAVVGLAATASSGLGVSFAVGSGPGSISESTNLSFSAVGTVSVIASQAGNANYAAAPDVTNSVSVYQLSENSGPYGGGNTITITNGYFGAITNVTIDGVDAVIQDNGDNWATITVPAIGAAGAKDIVVQTSDNGDTTLADAYTYNPAGEIGGISYGPSAWTNLGSGMNQWVFALTHDGHQLYAGGQFDSAEGSPANYIAQWNGAAWSALGNGMDNLVYDLLFVGTNLYAAGAFTNAGDVSANYVAMWNGSTWTNLGEGLNAQCSALACDGTNLYAGGMFTNAGGMSANHIAMWNGSAWTNLGSGMDQNVHSLAFYGATLYAGGVFMNAGGNSANYVAMWDGSAWTNMGSGMNLFVYELLYAGSSLYAAGVFTNAGGLAANRIARWDPATAGWTNLGEGLNAQCSALAYDGTNLYAGGMFTNAGGQAANYVAMWDPATEVWTNLGAGVNDYAYALALDGTNLYAGGRLTSAGGVAAPYVAKWGPSEITFSGIDPSSGSWTGGYQVVITGSNLGNGSDITNVTLCDVTVASIDSQSATQVVIVAGTSGAGGLGDVRVFSTSYGETVKSNAFEYLREQQAALVFTPTSPQAYLTTNALTTSGGSGTGVISYAVLSGPGTIVDDTNLTVTSGSGTIEIRALKAQDDLYFETIVTGTVSAAKAAGGVFLADLAQTYDGTARSVSATTDPSGLTVEFTYDGNTWAPTNAGSYAITGTINDVNYEGSATDTLVVNKADQTITFPAIDNQFWTNVVGLSATADSGLAVSFGVFSGPASISGETNLSFTGYGSVSVTADQAGDDNWNAAVTMTNTFSILGPGITILGTNGAVIVSEEAPSIAKGTEFPRTMWHYPAITNIFTITNSGTADLHIGGVTTNGSDYFRVVSWPTTVATQSTGNLVIAADPLTINTHTARMELAFNGADSPFALNLEVTVDPDVMSIWLPTQIVNGVERNIFDRDTWTVLQALTDLRDIVNQTNLTNIIVRFGGWPGYNPAFTNGDTARLGGDLDYLLDTFPLAPITYTNGIAVGEKSFIDQYGNYFTTDEPHLFEPLPYTNSYTLILEAGRHTAAAGIAQLLENVELVTRNNRIQIQASDNTQTQAIDFAALSDQLETNTTALSATASSGLDVSFLVEAGPAVLAGAISPTTMTYTNYGTVAIVASQTGDVAYLAAPEITNSFRVFGIFTVTVASAHGTASPAPGPYLYVEESVITNMIATPDTQETTQYVCGGWTMTGNEPLSGPGTNCIMTVTNDALLTWQWTTNYWLSVSDTTNGYVDAASGWQGFGTLLMITGTASNYYHFDQWMVTPGGVNTNNPLNLTIDQPYGLAAAFVENLTTNTGTPEWWLASFGLTNFEADAEGDADGDGVPTCQEYVADTIPTNPASLLELENIGLGTGARQLEWIGGTGVVQYLEWTTNANDASVWVVISTNTPPTQVTNQVDVFEDQIHGFYRIRAVR